MSVVNTDSSTTPPSEKTQIPPSTTKAYMAAAAPKTSSKVKGKDAGALFQGTVRQK